MTSVVAEQQVAAETVDDEPGSSTNPSLREGLRLLLEKATPGPYFVGMKGGGNVQSSRGPIADTLRFGNTSTEAVADYDNAHLIVAALNALPALLNETAEAERLREEVAEAETVKAGLRATVSGAIAAKQAAQARADRLEGALRGVMEALAEIDVEGSLVHDGEDCKNRQALMASKARIAARTALTTLGEQG